MSPKVVLIGWPGVDWTVLHRLVDDGSMPATRGLIERGVLGRLAAVAPVEPYPLWTSIATGRRAHGHGVLGLESFDPGSGAVVASTAAVRRVPALWEMLDARALRSHVVGWSATTGSRAIAGAIVSDAFGHPANAKTRSTLGSAIVPGRLEAALRDLWVHPEEVGDGVVQEFLRDWCGLDRIPAIALRTVSDALAFSFSRHAVFTWLLEHEAWNFAAVCWPATEWIAGRLAAAGSLQADADEHRLIYTRIVETSYRLHDELLAGTLDLVGDGANVLVVSPWGHGGGRAATDIRTALSLEQGGYRGGHGVMIAAGPRLARDSLTYGATVLDVAPTVLQLCDLPIGEDLDGRVLSEIFGTPPRIGTLASWQDEVRTEHDASSPVKLPTSLPQALRGRYEALGLIPASNETPTAGHPNIGRRLRWKLARSYYESQQAFEALPLLETLNEDEPENPVYALQLANCQLQLGLLEEARDTLEMILEERPDTALVHVCLARVEHRSGHHDLSLEHARQAVACGRPNPVLFNQLGLAYLNLRRWRDALGAFADSLACDRDQHVGHLGRARALLGLREFAQAADAALDAIGQNYPDPLAHYLLGIALLRQGMLEQAASAFEVAAKLAPGVARTHYQLIRVKHKLGARGSELDRHREALDAARTRRLKARDIRTAAVQRQQRRQAEKLELRRRAPTSFDDFEPADSNSGSQVPMNHTIVTGLPCAGASLVVQMLAAGGMPVLGDDQTRRADADWRTLADLWRDPDLLRQAQGHAIKLPAIFITELPRIHHYKMIFVHRPIAEVAQSQEALLRAADRDVEELPYEESVRVLRQHRDAVLALIRSAPNVDLVELDYHELCNDSVSAIEELLDFFGEMNLNPKTMAAVAASDNRRVTAAPFAEAAGKRPGTIPDQSPVES